MQKRTFSEILPPHPQPFALSFPPSSSPYPVDTLSYFIWFFFPMFPFAQMISCMCTFSWTISPLFWRVACQWRRHRRRGFDPWVRNIPWRRKLQPTPVFLPGESHGQRSLVRYGPWGCKQLDTTEHTCTHILQILFFALTSMPEKSLPMGSCTSSSFFLHLHGTSLRGCTIDWDMLLRGHLDRFQCFAVANNTCIPCAHVLLGIYLQNIFLEVRLRGQKADARVVLFTVARVPSLAPVRPRGPCEQACLPTAVPAACVVVSLDFAALLLSQCVFTWYFYEPDQHFMHLRVIFLSCCC